MVELSPERRLVVICSVVIVIICIIVCLSLLFTQRSKESQDIETGLPCSTSSAERSVSTWDTSQIAVQVETIVYTSEERHGLPTPPPTPVRPSIDEENVGQANHETRTSITNIYGLLEISKTLEGVSASILVEKHDDDSDNNVLQLVDIEWKSLIQDWETRVMELIGKDTYESATELSSEKGSQGLVIYAWELKNLIHSAKDCEALLRGFQIACPDVQV